MDLSELLGPLESEVMELMWSERQATVRDVVEILLQRRSIAYTTAMTIMNNLVKKGLLKRSPRGKAYLYAVVLSREEFLERMSGEAVSEVLEKFGDLAIARFAETVAKLSPEDLRRLQQLAKEKDQGGINQ